MSTPVRMEVKAVKLPAIRQYLEREHLYDEVVATLSPESRRLLEHPPLTTSWVPTARIYEIYEAVRKLRGPGAVKKLGYETSVSAYSPLVKRLVPSLLALVGATPATLFNRANSIVPMFERGTTYDFTDTGDRSGVMTIRTSEPIGPAAWEALESLVLMTLSFARVEGRTNVTEVSPDHCTIKISVEW